MSPWQRFPQSDGTTRATRKPSLDRPRTAAVQIMASCVLAILASCFPLPVHGQNSQKFYLSSATSQERNSIESEFKPESSQSLLAARYPQASGTSADHKKLQYFIGTWTLAGDVKTSPLGPGGSYTGTQENEMAADGLSVISIWNEKRPAGSDSGKAIYGYDAVRKIYSYSGTSKDGETENSTGAIKGDSWIWSSNLRTPSGQTMKARFIQKVTSPVSYEFRFEISSQDDTWITVLEGKAEKSK